MRVVVLVLSKVSLKACGFVEKGSSGKGVLK